jgi:cold shock CspA family protein
VRGVIIKMFPGKGFGFLKGEDGISRFVHASQTRPSFDVLRVGMRVEFQHSEHPRGARAVEVRPEGWK